MKKPNLKQWVTHQGYINNHKSNRKLSNVIKKSLRQNRNTQNLQNRKENFFLTPVPMSPQPKKLRS